MSKFQMILASVLSALWVALYATAAWIDHSVADLASSATPILLVVVGFVFGSATIDLFRKDKP